MCVCVFMLFSKTKKSVYAILWVIMNGDFLFDDYDNDDDDDNDDNKNNRDKQPQQPFYKTLYYIVAIIHTLEG